MTSRVRDDTSHQVLVEITVPVVVTVSDGEDITEAVHRRWSPGWGTEVGIVYDRPQVRLLTATRPGNTMLLDDAKVNGFLRARYAGREEEVRAEVARAAQAHLVPGSDPDPGETAVHIANAALREVLCGPGRGGITSAPAQDAALLAALRIR